MDIKNINILLKKPEDANHWINISNVFLVLMIIFALISIILITKSTATNNDVKVVISDYNNDNEEIYEALHEEFKDDLKKWNATISKETLSIVFHSYEFKSGSVDIDSKLKSILNSFFPRYMKTSYELADKISEVRIEGHTDDAGSKNSKTINDSYLYNLALSQKRTISILKYGFSIVKNNDDLFNWMRKTVTATGFSFSRPVLDKNGKMDKNSSRRVEFRILPKASAQLEKIDNILENK